MNETDENVLIYPVEEELHLRVLAERERCAAIAEEMSTSWKNGPAATVYGAGYQKACEQIAAAIRNGRAS